MEALTNHWPELLIAAGTMLALLLAARLILKGARERDPLLQGVSKDTRRAVMERRKAGDELGMADILYRAAHFEPAAEVYARANSPKRAAEAYERAGNAAMAIQAYKRAGLHERAARVAYDNGMYVIAAKEYESLGHSVRAAECFLKAEEHQQAAECYARGERYREAGILFARIGQKEAAAEQYVSHFEAQLVRAKGKLESVPEEALKMAYRAATYLKELDRLAEAAELLRRSGHYEESAPVYVKLGRLEEAADCLVEAGRPDQAAPLYERLGNVKAAARARAEARLMEGDTLGAAHAFARAGDLIRAAQLFREAEDNTAAAEMYRRAGDLVMAAELYSQNDQFELAATLFHEAGEFEQAARIFGSVGKFLQAAESWESAGNNYEAGASLFKAGRREAALKRLQNVPDGDDVGRRSRALEGRILFQLGRPEEAQEQFQKAIDGREASLDNIDLFYKLGRCAEAAGDMSLALTQYEAVVSVDPSFGDAQSRLAAIRDRLASMPAQQGGQMSPPVVWPTAGQHSGQQRSGAQPAKGKKSSVKSKWPVMSRYELMSEIARGGMGVVYKGRDRVLNRIVAFKVLSDSLKTNKTAVDYFLREARAAAAMSHPNIVTIYDAGEESGDFYMAMEYVEGETLKALIKRQGAFPEKLLRYIAVHACRGLVFAHNKGLVHRDIKSGNLMLTKEKILKIMDFGLAKFVEDAQLEHTKKIGTPYYMSPEQILGKELDRRSDIYSLGITLFECSTGKVPFAKGDLSYHHLHTPPPYAKDFNKNLSDKMNHLIARCIQKRPEERFQKCEDILEVLK